MAIFDLFSKRQRRARGDVPDVFTYDAIPQPLRIQISYIVQDAIGEDPYGGRQAAEGYAFIHDALCRERGALSLSVRTNPPTQENKKGLVLTSLIAESDAELVLDLVELAFRYIDRIVRKEFRYVHSPEPRMRPDAAIEELNARFKEHGVGYRFESGEMLRIDSDLLHAEAVKPALSLLREPRFKGANDEFLGAYEHYRHGRNKECLVDALKAFESTMKVICSKRGWSTQPSDTAKQLIATCLAKGLFPSYSESVVSQRFHIRTS